MSQLFFLNKTSIISYNFLFNNVEYKRVRYDEGLPKWYSVDENTGEETKIDDDKELENLFKKYERD